MSGLWTSDLTILWTDGRVRQLYPTKQMTFPERVNALVRLVILATVCIYLYNRDTRYVLYGTFCVALLTLAAQFGGQTTRLGAPPGTASCTHPTPNNPFMNVLLTDYKDNPNRPPACPVDQVSGEIERAYAASTYRDAGDIGLRSAGFDRFHVMPDTSCFNAGREAFAAAVYGTGPTCKEDQSRCGQVYP